MIRQINTSGQVKFTGKNFEQVIQKIPETSGTLLAMGIRKDQPNAEIVKFRVKAH